jgi:cell division protein FtsB
MVDPVGTELVSLPLAAYALHVTWHSAWQMALSGRLPATKIKGRWFVQRAELEKLVAERAAKEAARKELREAQRALEEARHRVRVA